MMDPMDLIPFFILDRPLPELCDCNRCDQDGGAYCRELLLLGFAEREWWSSRFTSDTFCLKRFKKAKFSDIPDDVLAFAANVPQEVEEEDENADENDDKEEGGNSDDKEEGGSDEMSIDEEQGGSAKEEPLNIEAIPFATSPEIAELGVGEMENFNDRDSAEFHFANDDDMMDGDYYMGEKYSLEDLIDDDDDNDDMMGAAKRKSQENNSFPYQVVEEEELYQGDFFKKSHRR